MSNPVSYEQFCIKYNLVKGSEESKAEYAKYTENLAFFTKAMQDESLAEKAKRDRT